MLFVAGEAFALDPTRQISQYAHKAWRMHDGDLPASVFPIAQTADGYLWLGTQAGVVRFDGVRFVSLSTLNSKPLPSQFVVSLLGDRDGSLWIGTTRGLSLWRDGKLVDYPDAEGGAFSLHEDQDGRIWFLTSSHTAKALCEIVDATVRCHGKEAGLDLPAKCCVPMMATDRMGTFWINTDRSVVRWRPGTQSESFPVEAKIRSGLPGFVVIATEPGGGAWRGIPAQGKGLGLQRFDGKEWKQLVTGRFDGSTLAPQALLRDRENALWIGTLDRGIYRILGDRVDHFDSADGLSSNAVYWLFEDREGNIWVSTSQGVDRFRDLRVASFTSREGLSADDVNSVLAGRDGRIWVGTALGIDMIERSQVSSIRAANGLPGNHVTSLMEDDVGRLWVGVDNTLSTYAGGRFVPVPGLDGRPLGFVYALVQDSRQNVWAAIRGKPRKLVRIREGKVREELLEPAIPAVTSLARDPQEGIWLGLHDGDLVRYRSGKLDRYSFGSAPQTRVAAVVVANDGTVLGATSQGVVALRNGAPRRLGAREGLPCDVVNTLVEDAQRSLWLNMECGLVRITRAELDAWWEQPERKIRVHVLDRLDGVRPGSAYFNGAARAPDGMLWFVNGTSAQTIDPSRSWAREHPPVHVEKLIVDRSDWPLAQPVRLPPLSRNVEIAYTALNLAIPERVRFRYRLEGHDDEWQEPGARRQAFYSDLPPGDYRFRVIASNNDGVWTESGATLAFSITPTFYQTDWFIGLCVAAGAGLLSLLYLLRVRRLTLRERSRFEERLAERTRLARELHDTLLQTIQGSKLVADHALDAPSDNARLRRAMEQLSTWLGQAINEGREALRALRGTVAGQDDLCAALKRAAEVALVDGSMQITCSTIGEVRELHPIVADEVYRIGYEAIRNACMHSGGGRLGIEVAYQGDFRLRVSDDGKGIGVDLATKDREGHYGLRGMRERAANIGGTLTVVSTPGRKGTQVELVVPERAALRR